MTCDPARHLARMVKQRYTGTTVDCVMLLRRSLLHLGTLAGLALPGQSDTPLLTRCHYRGEPDTVRSLPVSLQEISGLAFHRGLLLAHDDELGRIYTINPVTGAVAIFATLRGPIHDDFEGIAVLGDTVWLMTSSGKLYGVKATASRTPVAYALHNTGLGKRCELEGLAADAANGVLLFPCKALPKNGPGILIYRWNAAKGALAIPTTVSVTPKAIKKAGGPNLRPSALEVVPGMDHLLVLSSSPPALIELDGDGVPRGYLRLPSRHARPEGLAIAANGDIFVSDEGVNRTGTLSVYRCNP
jgi:uncharacterized protein YjiK